MLFHITKQTIVYRHHSQSGIEHVSEEQNVVGRGSRWVYKLVVMVGLGRSCYLVGNCRGSSLLLYLHLDLFPHLHRLLIALSLLWQLLGQISQIPYRFLHIFNLDPPGLTCMVVTSSS